MKTIGIIPARFASSRFPGKPLAVLGGKTMIQRVYERASSAELIDEVVVATDDERIMENVYSFGGQVQMTRPDHQSGTDRCAEVADARQDAGFIINIQGDEPFIDPIQINQVIRPLHEGKAAITTLARAINYTEELFNANIVKIVLNRYRQALYFSRSPIPYQRNVEQVDWIKNAPYYKHVGLYGFARTTLQELTNLPASAYEKAEALEQLRWLEAGHSIFVDITSVESLGVDTPEDLERARAFLADQQVGDAG